MSDYIDTNSAENLFPQETQNQPRKEEIINYLNQVKAYSDDNQANVSADDSANQQEVSTQEVLMALASLLEQTNSANHPKELSDEEIQALSKEEFLDMLLQQQRNSQRELDEKRVYLEEILPKFDSDDYLGNKEFKKLFTEAFKALGTKLDSDMFLDLVEKYVGSRISAKELAKTLSDETTNITDSLAFENGNSKKMDKKLRMQDIPEDELENYIAKYI